MQIILFKPYFLEFQWQNCTSPGGRIIDNLQIDNLQIDNRQINNHQIANRQTYILITKIYILITDKLITWPILDKFIT